MFKKISILTLLFTFFVSTTSLPITIHLCNMAKEMKTGTCTMHQDRMDNCVVDILSSKTTIHKSLSSCCETQVVDKSISDKFISVKTELNNIQKADILLYFTVNESITLNTNYNKNYFTSPPPGEKEIPLYLSNSIFLI